MGAGDKAEDYLRTMQSLMEFDPSFTPDIGTYECVMKSYVTSSGLNKDVNAGRKAAKLLNEMHVLWKTGHTTELRPTSICYISVMKAYYYSNLPKNVYLTLKRMERDFVDGNGSARPSINTYIVVLETWMKHKAQQKRKDGVTANDAYPLEILQSMKRVDIKPNKSLYNKLVNAISYIDNKKIREKAESMLKEMQLPASRVSATASSSSEKNSMKQKVTSMN